MAKKKATNRKRDSRSVHYLPPPAGEVSFSAPHSIPTILCGASSEKFTRDPARCSCGNCAEQLSFPREFSAIALKNWEALSQNRSRGQKGARNG